jgi:hypothetical protein
MLHSMGRRRTSNTSGLNHLDFQTPPAGCVSTPPGENILRRVPALQMQWMRHSAGCVDLLGRSFRRADEQHVRERKPLVASGVEPATGEEFAGTYQETNY